MKDDTLWAPLFFIAFRSNLPGPCEKNRIVASLQITDGPLGSAFLFATLSKASFYSLEGGFQDLRESAMAHSAACRRE